MREPRLTGRALNFEENLDLVFTKLPPGVLSEGGRWWPRATLDVEGIGRRFGVEKTRMLHAAGALSPGIPWDGVLDSLELLCRAHASGEAMPRGQGHLTFGYRGRERAWHVLQTGDVSVVRGPKVTAVVDVLFGIMDAVPVDRHVVRAATNTDIVQVSLQTSRRIGEAVKHVANGHGLKGSTFQAAIWLAGSRNVDRRGGTHP